MNPRSQADASTFAREKERERVLMEQLPQVKFIAHRIHERLPQHVALEDLVDAGVVGLIDALNKYDDRKNVQFKSYAKFRIRGAILDSLRDLDWSPRDLRRRGRELGEAHCRLEAKLGRSPSEPELAKEMGLPLSEFQHLLGELDGLEVGSLQVTFARSGEVENLTDFLPLSHDEDPFQICLKGEMKELLARVIRELPENEQQVLALYYYEELTMKEVGTVLGVCESRISQIHSMALLRLRARLRELLAVTTEAA